MNNIPFGGKSCCLPQAEGLTYLQVGPKRHPVGMMGLETVFQQLLALERSPEEVSDAEIIGMARRSNYIPPKPDIEANYAAALRKAYSSYCEQSLKQAQTRSSERK